MSHVFDNSVYPTPDNGLTTSEMKVEQILTVTNGQLTATQGIAGRK